MEKPKANQEYYSTGIPLFDNYTKELLETVTKMEMDLCCGKADIDHEFRKQVCKLVRTLTEYFHEQERWMHETGFCGCEIEKKSHDYFIHRIEKASMELENNLERACDLTCFLKTWLISHIRSTSQNLKFHAAHKPCPCLHNVYEITTSTAMPLQKRQ